MIQRLTISLLSLLLFASCANIQPPNGGPEDKTPPTVDTSAISTATTNFHNKSVWLHFSEHVDKGKVLENIIISPEKRLEYSWSGRELEIQFAEPLDSNTTYSLTLGTDYTDLHGNKPSEAYTMIFSTGSKLDSGVIRGKLVDANPSGAYIFLYSISTLNIDTLDFSATKPRYRTQCGTSGTFEFRALPSGIYRIIALRDENRNSMYDATTDAFGTTSEDIVVTDGTPAHVELRMNPARDRQPLELAEVRAKSRVRVDVIFSKIIDTLSVKPIAFEIYDSARTKSISIKAAYISVGNAKSITLLTSPFDSTRAWKLKIRTDSLGIRDTAANRCIDSLSSQTFSSSLESDTNAPQLLAMSIRDSSKNVALKPTFTLLFSSGVVRKEVETRIALFKQNAVVESQLHWRGDNELRITPKDSLAAEAWYELRFRMNDIHGVNGSTMKDSLMRLRFQILDTRNLGTVKGELVDSSSKAKSYIVSLIDKNKVRRTQSLEKQGSFLFSNVPEGEYTLEAFCDTDGNGVYSSGTAKPFSFAERFVVSEKSISVKQRWTVDGVKIVFPNSKR